jgi:hypothetical protein
VPSVDPVFAQADIEERWPYPPESVHSGAVRFGDVPVRTAILQHFHMDTGFTKPMRLMSILIAEQALDVHRGGERTDAGQVDAFEGRHVAHLHVLDGRTVRSSSESVDVLQDAVILSHGDHPNPP